MFRKPGCPENEPERPQSAATELKHKFQLRLQIIYYSSSAILEIQGFCKTLQVFWTTWKKKNAQLKTGGCELSEHSSLLIWHRLKCVWYREILHNTGPTKSSTDHETAAIVSVHRGWGRFEVLNYNIKVLLWFYLQVFKQLLRKIRV